MDDLCLNDQLILFQGEGQITEETAIFLEEVYGVGATRSAAGEISTPFRAKSYFSIGEPIVLPLVKLLTESGESVSADIRLQMQKYDFYQVQLACSFQAAPGCRFDEARFVSVLHTTASRSTQTVVSDAIAYDLFPLLFEDTRKVSIKKSLNPLVKFGFDTVSSSVALPLYEQSETYVTYTSRVEAFDLRGSKPAWKFMRTASHGIGGPQKLFLIVRKPKGTQVHVTFELEALVQFKFGGITDLYPLVMRFRYRDSPSTLTYKPTIPLC